MYLQPASRKNTKIKMALQGVSGSGKTYSALLLAFGLCNQWNKIAIIDTENHSSELYAHLGDFRVLHLSAPYTPERYIEAIHACEDSGAEVIITDSISHEWQGSGGILEMHSRMPGNSYTNWSKITPRHNAFVQCLLQSPVHIISTIRSKQDYILIEKNGKQVPQKVGMKGIIREGMDYEFTIVFELDNSNNAIATKDRTSLFTGNAGYKINTETGKQILNWCNEGAPPEMQREILLQRINGCKSMDELLKLYYTNPIQEATIIQAFSLQRSLLEKKPIPAIITHIKNQQSNGNSHAATV